MLLKLRLKPNGYIEDWDTQITLGKWRITDNHIQLCVNVPGKKYEYFTETMGNHSSRKMPLNQFRTLASEGEIQQDENGGKFIHYIHPDN